MKKSVRIVGVAILAAIFCFSASLVSSSPIHSADQNQLTIEQEQSLAVISSSFSFHQSQSENSVNSFQKIPVPNFKRFSDKHWSITQFYDQLFESKFVQYCNSSRSFLIQLQKSDIIFPFHYFW
jgi:hypothetical protein